MARIGRPPKPAPERFASRIRATDDGCIEWTGWLDKDGYGQLDVDGRLVRAHRYAYELHVGPIPDGLVIDHLCRNRSCVNHEHLEPVTVRENTLRGVGTTAHNAVKTACKRGHPLAADNLVSVPGGRGCRTCRLEATRRWRSRQNKETF